MGFSLCSSLKEILISFLLSDLFYTNVSSLLFNSALFSLINSLSAISLLILVAISYNSFSFSKSFSTLSLYYFSILLVIGFSLCKFDLISLFVLIKDLIFFSIKIFCISKLSISLELSTSS